MRRVMLVGAIVLSGLITPRVARGREQYPPETRNAALRYWMAFAEMQDPPGDEATRALLEKTVAGQTPWNEKTLGPILDANDAAIQMMQRATALPDCDWGLEYGRGPTASIAYAPRARVLARLNTLQGVRQMANGDSRAAVRTWLAGVQFSQHLSKGGTLIFALIAKASLLPNLRALTEAAKKGQLNAAEKKQVTTAIGAMREDAFDWANAWGLEGLGGVRFLTILQQSKDAAATYHEYMGGDWPVGSKTPTKEDVQQFREYTGAIRKAMALPPDVAKARIAELAPSLEKMSEIAKATIPSAARENEARAEVVQARAELLAGLGK